MRLGPSPPPASVVLRREGMLFALIGGAAVVLGFLALPMRNAGPFGSYPAIQLVGILSAAGVPAGSPLAIYLWLLVIAGVLIALVAGVCWVSSGRSGRPPQSS